MPRLVGQLALAGRLCLSALSGEEGLADAWWPLAVCGVQSPAFGDGGNRVSGQQAALDGLVPGDVADDEPKNGVSALGLQRELGFGSYKTAWTVLHKLRRAMVRPGRDRLHGVVEVDEAYWGGEEIGVRGRLTYAKARIAVAAEAAGHGVGRIRLRQIPDTSRKTLHGFITEVIEPGSTVQTDGWPAYRELRGYVHIAQVHRGRPKEAEALLPRVHRVISLLRRWLLGTHQWAVAAEYLQDYLDEFTFRFNRRTSASRGKLFYRLAQQAVQVAPTTHENLGHHKR